jgi:AAA domain
MGAEVNAELGKYADGFNGFRRMMAAVPPGSRLLLFQNACKEAAVYVGKGLDRALAADELTDIAVANGLEDTQTVQWCISQAFLHIEEDRFPDDDDEPEPEHKPNGKGNGKDHHPPPSATAYIFPDPELIPPRQWLYGGHYVRNAVTATVAPGGFGKTTLTLYELIAMAANGLRCWYISGEDPRVEIDRRIAAHCEQHKNKIDKRVVANNLFVDDKISFPLFIGQCQRNSVVKFDDLWLTLLESEIRNKKLDVVALDPFISFHSVPESDNGSIDQVVKRLFLIAQNTGCCIELSHHVRKAVQGSQAELTVDDTRGGSAIVNAVRSCRVFNRMSANEAALAKVPQDKRTAYVRIDKGKRNMAPAEKASWWHIVSVHLPNGDNVQAIEPYNFPSAFEGLSEVEVTWVQDFLKNGGPRRASSQSDDWLGHHIGLHVGREDTHEKGGAIWANKIISQWIANKVFKKIAMRDPESRKPNIAFYADNGFRVPDEEMELELRKPRK